jgi:hypothetical protein
MDDHWQHSTFAVLRLLLSLHCVRLKGVAASPLRRTDAAECRGTARGRYGVGDVVESAKDQRVGARMSASQPKTTRGRTR